MEPNEWRVECSAIPIRHGGVPRGGVLLAAVLMTLSLVSPAQAQGERAAMIRAMSAPLRSQPDARRGLVIAQLRAGETVTILDQQVGARRRAAVWYLVRAADGLEGYLRSSVVVEVTPGSERERAMREALRRQRARHIAWTGFYMGVNAGYGSGDEASLSFLADAEAGEIDGFDGGAQAGLSYLAGRFLFGIEGDVQISNQSGSTDFGTVGFPESGYEFEYDFFTTVRGRIGLVAGRALVYATGGYAYAEGSERFTGPFGSSITPLTAEFEGSVLGGGIETVLSDGVSLKVEALSLDFDPEPRFRDAEFLATRIGLNWRF